MARREDCTVRFAMITRRQFLAGSLALAGLRLVPREPPRRIARVGTMTSAGQIEIERGLSFGFAEAERTAALFGWRVERVPVDPTTTRHDVDTVISAVAARSEPGRLVLSLTCEAVTPGALVLADCERSRSSAPRTRQAADVAKVRVSAWHSSLERYGAAQLNDRYRAAMNREMTGDAWLAWFAVKALSETIVRANSTDPAAIRQRMLAPETRFDGHKGAPLHFDPRGMLRQPLYELRPSGTGTWRVERELPPPTVRP